LKRRLYKGDVGHIDDVDPEAGELKATFDGRSVTYGFGELDTLVPAYAHATPNAGRATPSAEQDALSDAY
jgi:hypothetical protein